MQTQHHSVVAQSEDQTLVELDLAALAHVGGGTPKGTWNDPTLTSSLVVTLAIDLDPTPKGTW
ncbi:MAG: hypothetical protein ABW220_02960 [Burkholderiaceae bacterium]